MSNRLNPYKSLYALFLTAILAFSCVSGEKEAPDLPEMVEVDLQVGVDDVSQPVQTKASDTRALPGEQIHSLVVFIVNSSGTVEKKFEPDLTGTAADNGELEKWTSESFKLTRGTKRVYAFANWEALNNNSFISTEEGVTLTLPETVEWTNNSFAPAAGKYLPMSFKDEAWTVSSSGTKKIELVRLVSRLKVFVRNEAGHPITVNSVKIGSFNTSSYLFGKGNILSTTSPGWSIENILKGVSLKDQSLESNSDWIYVNESEEEQGFEVVLETTSEGSTHDVNMHSGTKRTSFVKRIPRNHVWNLHLVFASYQLTLGIKGENPPIGGYPDVMTNVNIEQSLACNIVGGGPFTLTIKELESVETSTKYEVDKLSWSIALVNNDDGLLVEDLSIKGTTITGRMAGAASADQTATFILECQNTAENRTLSFTVTLRFVDLFQQQP